MIEHLIVGEFFKKCGRPESNPDMWLEELRHLHRRFIARNRNFGVFGAFRWVKSMVESG